MAVLVLDAVVSVVFDGIDCILEDSNSVASRKSLARSGEEDCAIEFGDEVKVAVGRIASGKQRVPKRSTRSLMIPNVRLMPPWRVSKMGSAAGV